MISTFFEPIFLRLAEQQADVKEVVEDDYDEDFEDFEDDDYSKYDEDIDYDEYDKYYDED